MHPDSLLDSFSVGISELAEMLDAEGLNEPAQRVIDACGSTVGNERTCESQRAEAATEGFGVLWWYSLGSGVPDGGLLVASNQKAECLFRLRLRGMPQSRKSPEASGDRSHTMLAASLAST